MLVVIDWSVTVFSALGDGAYTGRRRMVQSRTGADGGLISDKKGVAGDELAASYLLRARTLVGGSRNSA
jgi:hypothetical protein